MHVEEQGSGRPVVLLHGWGAASSTWRPRLAALADEFHVLAPDLPGFGATPPLPRSDAPAFADALRELIDERRLRDVLLVGWSMGGLVALEYASRFACRSLSGLAIVDVAPRARPAPDWPVDAAFGRSAERWSRRWRDEREAVVREVTELAFVDPNVHRREVEKLVADALRADADAAIAIFRDLVQRDYRGALQHIRVPMLLLFGGASTSTSCRDAEAAASLARNSRLRVFDGCGHALMIEAPERFDAELRSFAHTLAATAA